MINYLTLFEFHMINFHYLNWPIRQEIFKCGAPLALVETLKEILQHNFFSVL
jgi:hypothetical protein